MYNCSRKHIKLIPIANIFQIFVIFSHSISLNLRVLRPYCVETLLAKIFQNRSTFLDKKYTL